MKKTAYISMMAVAAMMSFSSCDDTLDVESPSTMGDEIVYSTYTYAEAAVMSIHQSFGETNSYRGRFLPYYGMNTDCEWINGAQASKIPDAGKYDLCAYNATDVNGQMNVQNVYWAKLYEAIERANCAIEGLRKYAKTDDLKYLLGECLTLRAMVYVDLVKAHGDVVARFEPVTAATMYQAKSDRDIIYKQLLADLKEAEDYLPWANETAQTSTTERVSKDFAKGLRARVALYAGGYSQRADGVRLSNDPELSQSAMWQIAKEECVDVVNNHAKLGAFVDNFKALCQDNTVAGKESLFEIPFSDGRGRVIYTFGLQHSSNDQYTKQAKGGQNGPVPTLFYAYSKNDIRRDITCCPYQWGKANADGIAVQELRNIYSWCFGKLRYEWMNRLVTSTNDDGCNWQVMRMADVYLMAAEAINELEGPANATQYMKPVLDRALPAKEVTDYMASASASKEAFRQAVKDQRKLEFAGEMLRKMDLIRWGELGKTLEATKKELTEYANRQGKYADLPEKLYIMNEGEVLKIYGLEHGDSEEYYKENLKDLGYASKSWFSSTDEKTGEVTNKFTDDYIDALYVNDPDKNQFWPIWSYFISNSNGMLTND